ncbi:MAG: hypothetical protein SH868_01680 [Bythopirellula sp.]|nr:hypothetical protein [Bythopirellula sp.]
MTLRILSFGFIVVASLLADQVSAQLLGHYHLPSTLPQFCGLGYGPGHHAPMVRPMDCHPPRQQRYVRVSGCGSCGALPLESFPTCGGNGCTNPGSHVQLNQLLGVHNYDRMPDVADAPPEQAFPLTEESILPTPDGPQTLPDTPQSPLLPMLP